MKLKNSFMLFNRLSVRVFIVVWLSMALMITLTVLLSRLDQRRILDVTEKEQVLYATQIVKRLLSTPPEFYLDQTQNSYLIIVPEDTDARYNAIHQIPNEQFVSFIINTLSSNQIYQQAVGRKLIVGPFRIKGNSGFYYYVTHSPPQSYYLSRLYSSPLMLSLLISLISLPFVIYLTITLSRPMDNLRKAALRVARGDWTEDRTLERGPIEYRTLARTFNQMLNALSEAEDEKNRLFANLSHELRTPLTRIRLANSLMRLRKTADPENIQRIDDNLGQLEDRIQAMLSLSRQMILHRDLSEPLEIEEILLPLLDDAAFEANENGKKLIYNDIPTLSMNLNAELFHSGLENILRNAIYYAKSKIEVTLTQRNRKLYINVHDDGPGVAESELEELFKAFFRGERPEGMIDYGGSGLGLAIAQQMVNAHYGEIHAKNDNGLSITIILPLSPIP